MNQEQHTEFHSGGALPDFCRSPSHVEFDRSKLTGSVPQAFEEQVAAAPDSLAIKSVEAELSYAQLNVAANRVASSLLETIGATNKRVGLLFEPSAPQIATIFGILKSANVYVPLDPTYPEMRTSSVLVDSGAEVMITNTRNLALAKSLVRENVRLINYDELEDELSIENPKLPIPPTTLAYILYTSGSTGEPKGAVHTHQNLLQVVRNFTNGLFISRDDRIPLLSSFGFNMAIKDTYGALLNGASLYPFDMKKEGVSQLAGWLQANRCTIFRTVPTVFRHFVRGLDEDASFPDLRMVYVSGEPATAEDFQLYMDRFPDDCYFVNSLGSTETGPIRRLVASKSYVVEGSLMTSGYELDDKEVLILDESGSEVAVGQPGEIAVHSKYLATGYWNKPELTKEVFKPSPVDEDKRIFLTGDLGLIRADGNLVHLGRKDFQVKIRGQRVEIAEIELALKRFDGVEEVAVVASSNRGGTQRLSAFITTSGKLNGRPGDIRGALANELPDYMVPASITVVDALPLTESGKIDRRTLLDANLGRPDLQVPFARPRTPLEEDICRIWAEILEIDQVGINDDFLELGGDSLMAATMMALLEDRFQKKLPLAELIDASTVAEMAELLSAEKPPTRSMSLVPIQPHGDKPPFFCVHGAGGHVLGYAALSRRIGGDRPFFGLEAPGRDGEQPPLASVEALAERYVTEIQLLYPSGPYYLGGLSMGGAVAFEMARLLVERGEDVAFLAMLDTSCPEPLSRLRQSTRFVNRGAYLVGRACIHLAQLLNPKAKERTAYFSAKKRVLRSLVIADSPVRRINERAFRKYVPREYPGNIHLFWAEEHPATALDRRWDWQRFAIGGIEVHKVPGDHLSMMKEPNLRVIADLLKSCLDEADADPR